MLKHAATLLYALSPSLSGQTVRTLHYLGPLVELGASACRLAISGVKAPKHELPGSRIHRPVSAVDHRQPCCDTSACLFLCQRQPTPIDHNQLTDYANLRVDKRPAHHQSAAMRHAFCWRPVQRHTAASKATIPVLGNGRSSNRITSNQQGIQTWFVPVDNIFHCRG